MEKSFDWTFDSHVVYKSGLDMKSGNFPQQGRGSQGDNAKTDRDENSTKQNMEKNILSTLFTFLFLKKYSRATFIQFHQYVLLSVGLYHKIL